VATLLTGAFVSLAKLISPKSGTPGPQESAAYHLALSAFALLTLGLISAARASRDARTQLLGTLSAVVSGLLFMLGQHTPLQKFWVLDAGVLGEGGAAAMRGVRRRFMERPGGRGASRAAERVPRVRCTCTL
jgi:hypothetical protein